MFWSSQILILNVLLYDLAFVTSSDHHIGGKTEAICDLGSST